MFFEYFELSSFLFNNDCEHFIYVSEVFNYYVLLLTRILNAIDYLNNRVLRVSNTIT